MKSEKIIEAKFKRFDLNFHKTHLWNDLSVDDQQILLSNCRLNAGEKPIIVFLSKEKNWLLTNENFILNENGFHSYYLLAKIDGIKVSTSLMDGTSKRECSKIEIIYQERIIEIPIEPGTWHAIYNLLKFMTGGKGIV